MEYHTDSEYTGLNNVPWHSNYYNFSSENEIALPELHVSPP